MQRAAGVALNLGKSQRSPVEREMALKSPVYVAVIVFTVFIVWLEDFLNPDVHRNLAVGQK